MCDGALDCADFSDECLCEEVTAKDICGVIYDVNVNVSEECKYTMGKYND